MTEKALIRSGEYFQFFRSEVPTSHLAVVFSSRASRPPSFTFWKNFQQLPCNVIFLNCDVPSWYRTGVPGLAGGLRGLARAIEEFASETGSRRVVAIGSSMGAYGAALMGHFTHFDDMLLFGLEPLLGVPGGQTEETRNQHMPIYPDLRQVNWGKATVLYGEMDINDVLGATLLHDKKKGDLICVPFAQHDTPDFLAKAGVLSAMFSRFVSGDDYRPVVSPERTPHADERVRRMLWAANGPFSTKNWQATEEALTSFKSVVQRSFTARYLSALCAYKLGNADLAAGRFRDFIEEVPLFWEGWLNLSAALQRSGSIHEAIDAALNALRLRPHRSIAHFQMASTYEAAGNPEKALRHAIFAHRLNNLNGAYRAAVAKLADSLGQKFDFQKVPQLDSYREAAGEATELFGDFSHFWDRYDEPPLSLRPASGGQSEDRDQERSSVSERRAAVPPADVLFQKSPPTTPAQ